MTDGLYSQIKLSKTYWKISDIRSFLRITSLGLSVPSNNCSFETQEPSPFVLIENYVTIMCWFASIRDLCQQDGSAQPDSSEISQEEEKTKVKLLNLKNGSKMMWTRNWYQGQMWPRLKWSDALRCHHFEITPDVIVQVTWSEREELLSCSSSNPFFKTVIWALKQSWLFVVEKGA